MMDSALHPLSPTAYVHIESLTQLLIDKAMITQAIRRLREGVPPRNLRVGTRHVSLEGCSEDASSSNTWAMPTRSQENLGFLNVNIISNCYI